MIRIEQILSNFQDYTHHQIDGSAIQKAYVLAVKHLNQKSFRGPSRLETSLEVAFEISKLKLDLQSLVAGLLHPILLEGRLSDKELASLLGDETAKILILLKDLLVNAEKVKTDDQIARNMRQIVQSSAKDLRVLFILLLVRLIKLRHWSSFSKQKSQAFAKETLEIYAPLAERVGLAHIKAEMEDHCFALNHPKESKEVKAFCETNQSRHKSLLAKYKHMLEGIFEEHKIQVKIEGRIKHAYSLWAKSQRKHIEFQNMHDLIGLRVIVQNHDELHQVLGILHGSFHPVPDRFKDYVSFPKPNGYQALHTMLLDEEGDGFEVQIRTQEMHELAEMGIAAHWAYKATSQPKEKDLSWLKALASDLKITSDPKESLELFTRELYSDLVYVFTPKAKIIKLPFGSTALDFAYQIHTELGNQCVGAIINGQHTSIDHPLRHGDKVEILTSNEQHPTPAWLESAQTSRAIKEIRSAIRKMEVQEAKMTGEDILNFQLKKLGYQPDLFVERAEFLDFLRKHDLKDYDEYLLKLGFGQESINGLTTFIQSKNLKPVNKLAGKLGFGGFNKRPDRIKINGIEGIPIHLAGCCQPIPEDSIVGILSQGKGVKVHKTECQHLKQTRIDPAKLLDAFWVSESNEAIIADLTLQYPESMKIQIQILKALQSAKVELIESLLKNVAGKSRQDLRIKAQSSEQVAKLIKRLNGFEAVRANLVEAPGLPTPLLEEPAPNPQANHQSA